MVAAAVGINIAAGLIFLAWPTVTGLLIGRVVSGISAGLLTATATAYLTELHSSSRPGVPSARAEFVSTAANLGGLGFGALLAGFLAEYGASPLMLPYLVAEGLMLAGAIALAAAPETVVRPDRRRATARSDCESRRASARCFTQPGWPQPPRSPCSGSSPRWPRDLSPGPCTRARMPWPG